jgi:hypothetical protein
VVDLGRDIKLELDYDDGRILTPHVNASRFRGDPSMLLLSKRQKIARERINLEGVTNG